MKGKGRDGEVERATGGVGDVSTVMVYG
jgi:hypothetical protein